MLQNVRNQQQYYMFQIFAGKTTLRVTVVRRKRSVTLGVSTSLCFSYKKENI